MDIYMLNSDWKTIAIIGDFTSLIWRRKYYKVGDFELHCGPDYYPILSAAEYIYRNDRSEIGVIEQIELDKETCVLKGRFLECLLSRYIIYPTKDYANQTAAYIAQQLVSSTFPFTTSCTSVNVDTIKTSHQITGENLMDYNYELLKVYESGQKLTYDFGNKRFNYTVYRGLDRRQSQSENSWAVFSPDWDNLQTLKYSKSVKDYRNYAIVAGQGDGADRIVVTVDRSNGNPIRQLWVDAKDIRQEDGMTDAEYKQLLQSRGEAKLSEYLLVEKCDADIDPFASLNYRVDYDLGDLCTIGSPQFGITLEQRITEIEEVYEQSSFTISVQFGDGYLIVTDYLKRALK